MKKQVLLSSLLAGFCLLAQAQNGDISKDVETDEVVVTGTRNKSDIRLTRCDGLWRVRWCRWRHLTAWY